MTPALATGNHRFRSCWSRSQQRRFLPNRPVTINAVNFYRRTWLAVDFSVAMIVLLEMAIVALHPLFQMNVCEVYCFSKAIGIVECDWLTVLVEPVSLAIVVEHRAENPAVSVEIGELRSLQLLVEICAARLPQEFLIAPKSSRRGRFGVPQIGLIALLFRRTALLLRIHFVAVRFVVPPCQAKISRDHVRARMNVANHALARRNRACEGVFNRMARFALWNRWIGGCAKARVSKRRVCA